MTDLEILTKLGLEVADVQALAETTNDPEDLKEIHRFLNRIQGDRDVGR